MIDITPVNPLHLEASLGTPGGFAWWYIDLVDAQGSGAVLVWSFGLPFLPGSRKLELPSERPSLHLATYERGRPRSYLLQCYRPDEASIDLLTGSGKMGRTIFDVERSGDELRLSIQLDEKIPSSKHRLLGEIKLQGKIARLSAASSSVEHSWSPQSCFAEGELELQEGEKHWKLSGSGYFDANASAVPLHQQPIESWRWGRVCFADSTWIYYDVSSEDDGESLICIQDEQGFRQVTGSSTFSSSLSGRYGLKTARKVTLEAEGQRVEIALDHLVDDGPFYQRFVSRAVRSDGAAGTGVSELVHPHKVDVPWQRPFVRMRTHSVGDSNSIWLPLFSGTNDARGSRLLRSFMTWGRS